MRIGQSGTVRSKRAMQMVSERQGSWSYQGANMIPNHICRRPLNRLYRGESGMDHYQLSLKVDATKEQLGEFLHIVKSGLIAVQGQGCKSLEGIPAICPNGSSLQMRLPTELNRSTVIAGLLIYGASRIQTMTMIIK